MYCYYNVSKACEELGKDIVNACYWASDTIEEQAYGAVKTLVEVYNKQLKKLISQKVAEAEKVVNAMPEDSPKKN